MTLGHSWSLHSEPNESLKLHHRYNWCLNWPMNEIKWNTYEWMKQTPCLLKRTPSLRSHMLSPHFWEVLMSSPWFQGLMAYEWIIWTTLYVIWIMICAMWNMLCVVCKMISLMIHGMTFQIQIWQVHWLSWSKFGKSTDLTFHNHVVRKELFLIRHFLGVCLHISILSKSVY